MNLLPALAQINVSGTVRDVKSEPLIGVNITVKGSKTGTITDVNGNYTIQVPNNKAILQFSYIGFKPLEKQVATGAKLNVTLEEDSRTIDEVVVVAYGTQRKSHLTGAVASLKNDKLDDLPVSRVDLALQGKLAGIQINNTNPEAGATPQIRVRGLGSISANPDPLVVIDGFPVPDGLSMLSMGDVESIEVLKDASSAALYGSRAAGGVILVTTKSGKADKAKFMFKMYTGVRTALKLPDIMSTDKYISLLYSEAAQRRLDPSVDGTSNTMAFNKITDPERATYLLLHNFVDQPTDWVEEGMRKTGSNQNYQLSASGGNKNLQYYVSGNYSSEKGIMKESSYDKYTFRAKMDAKLTPKITLGVNLAPSYSETESPGTNLTDYMRFPSWFPIRHNAATAALTGKTAGDYAQPSDFNGISINGVGYDGEIWNLVGVSPFSSSNQNPVSVRERTGIFTDDYRLQGNTSLSIEFIKGLIFKTSNSFYAQYKEYNKKEQTSASKAGTPNTLTRQTTLHTELLSENTLNYTKQYKGHEFSGLLGVTFQKTANKYNQIVGTNFPDEELLSFDLATQILLDSPSVGGTTSYYYTEALASFLGRLNYSYRGKYMASVSMRSDGSSKFASGHKWGSFPAASVGWSVSEEPFMKKIDWISKLKFRASIGLTGNNNIPQYSYMNILNTSNYALGSGTGSLVPGLAATSAALGNPDITWEQTTEENYGVDFSVLNSRFNVSLEYYNSHTVQLLLKQPSMNISGHQSYWNNIGKVRNRGIEIELNTTNIVNKDFTWKTSANFSTNKNKLLNYGDKDHEYNYGERQEIYYAQVGYASRRFYGYKASGVYTTFEEVNAAKNKKDANGNLFTYTKFAPILGGLKVEDTNGDNKLDTDDRQVLGSPDPDFTWGLTNTFNYKRFDLSFMFQGVQGCKVINGNVYYNEQLRYNTAYTKNRYVSPMFPGDGQTVYSNTTSGNDLMLTDYCIEDGSYIALRDFSLGYTIPEKLMKLVGFTSLRAYVSAQNLLYIMGSGYRGVNPEARVTTGTYNNPLIAGYQRGVFPLNRTYTIGFDLTF
jgi:TonB-linked SusC/RagA family outer membrane protein